MADFRRLQELGKWNGAEVPVTKSGPKPILSSILALGMVGFFEEEIHLFEELGERCQFFFWKT